MTAHWATDVVCPLCGGEAKEILDTTKAYARYRCNSCGYVSDTDAAEDPGRLTKYVPKKLRPFVKWAQFSEESLAVFLDPMLWWPEEFQKWTDDSLSYCVTPIVVKGKLRWRRRNAETVEKNEHPRWSEDYADFVSFREATRASKEGIQALAWVRRTRPRMRIFRERLQSS